MFSPMFHGQNRNYSIIPIISPDQIQLIDPANWMWINSEANNVILYKDSQDWVTSYYNIANRSELFSTHTEGLSDRPLLVYNYYNSYNASKFIGASGLSGIDLTAKVTLESNIPILPTPMFFYFGEFIIRDYYDIIYQNFYGDWSSSEIRRWLVCINETSIIFGNVPSSSGDIIVKGSYNHGFSIGSTQSLLLTFSCYDLYVNGEFACSATPPDFVTSFGLKLNDYEFYQSDANPFSNNYMIECIGYPRELNSTEISGVCAWFNNKYNIW